MSGVAKKNSLYRLLESWTKQQTNPPKQEMASLYKDQRPTKHQDLDLSHF